MRVVLFALALIVMAIPPAQATEGRITVPEIHNFISHANSSLNNPNLGVGRDFLMRTVSDNAVFENRMAVYNTTPAAWDVYYSHPYYTGYHRYPLFSSVSPVSMRALSKWDNINLFESKKRTIAGYWSDMGITNISIRPYGRSAVVDIDMKEYSLGYAPLNPNLTTRVMHANSKCKMYLGKSGGDLFMTRLDCNTNSSLPF